MTSADAYVTCQQLGPPLPYLLLTSPSTPRVEPSIIYTPWVQSLRGNVVFPDLVHKLIVELWLSSLSAVLIRVEE